MYRGDVPEFRCVDAGVRVGLQFWGDFFNGELSFPPREAIESSYPLPAAGNDFLKLKNGFPSREMTF